MHDINTEVDFETTLINNYNAHENNWIKSVYNTKINEFYAMKH